MVARWALRRETRPLLGNVESASLAGGQANSLTQDASGATLPSGMEDGMSASEERPPNNHIQGVSGVGRERGGRRR